MKKFFYLSFIILLFSCSSNKGDNIITATFPAEGTDVISWLDLFPDMEMIRLTGEHMPMLSPWVGLIVRDNNIYVIDPFHTKKVHRFDRNGLYLNSIGSNGRGPNEYLYLTDMMVDNHGNISIYSGMGQGVLLTYSPNGELINRFEIPNAPQRVVSLNGFNYHYMGNGTGMDYQLYVTDKNWEIVGQYLPSFTVPTLQHSGTFSLYGESLNLCPPDDNNIYQLQNGKMEVKYRFNFGTYNLPDEHYRLNGFPELIDYLTSNTVVNKNAFYENKHCAILELNIMKGIEYSAALGLLNKQKNVWKWFNWTPDEDFIFFRHFDDEYAYFTADLVQMKQTPGLIGRFPDLNLVTDNEGMVILRSKTKNLNL